MMIENKHNTNVALKFWMKISGPNVDLIPSMYSLTSMWCLMHSINSFSASGESLILFNLSLSPFNSPIADIMNITERKLRKGSMAAKKATLSIKCTIPTVNAGEHTESAKGILTGKFWLIEIPTTYAKLDNICKYIITFKIVKLMIMFALTCVKSAQFLFNCFNFSNNSSMCRILMKKLSDFVMLMTLPISNPRRSLVSLLEASLLAVCTNCNTVKPRT